MVLKCLLVLFAAATLSLGHPQPKRSYKGHSVLRVTPKDVREVNAVKQLLHNENYDVWQSSQVPNRPVDIRVSPEEKQVLISHLEKRDLNYEWFINDLQSVLEEESRSQRSKRATRTSYLGLDLEQYHSYDEITAWLQRVDSDCDMCSVQNIGKTHQNRDMKVIKIAKSSSSNTKRGIFIDCGIHAREWVTPATCLNIIHRLLTDTDSETTALLSHYDFYILPVANPDGYEYSRSSDRMWRKNRRPSRYRGCEGVDLNRNFGYYWGVSGTSTDPCSDIYGGRGGFSEPESQNMRDFILTIASTTDMYLSFHSYGQMWLHSWGYTRDDAPDDSLLDNVGAEATQRIRSMYRKRYTYGSAADVLYASAGGSDDWAKGGAGIKYSYTVELRDTGRYGFVLPSSLIQPTADEAWGGVKAAATKIKQLHPNGTK